MVKEKSKIIAEYLGWKYIPYSKDSDLKPGWYEPNIGKGSIRLKDNRLYRYFCRNHNQLRFYNSFDYLIPVIEKIESEDLSKYFKNFEYLEFVRDNFTTEIQLLQHPEPVIILGDGKGEGIIKDAFNAIYTAVEYINKVKKDEK